MDKKIIQRNLPLNVKYTLVNVSYISILDGACTCDNCNKLISNIATVQDENDIISYIGMDCLETFLLNNKLLDNESYATYVFSDKPAIQKAKQLRSKILAQQKKDDTFKAGIYMCKDGLRFGFSFSKFNKFRNCEEPQGFDFTYNAKYLDLTIAHIKDLPNIKL